MTLERIEMAKLHPYCFTAQIVVWATSPEEAEGIAPAIAQGYDEFDWVYDDWTSNDSDWVEAMGGIVEA